MRIAKVVSALFVLGSSAAASAATEWSLRVPASKDASVVYASYAGCGGAPCPETNFGATPLLELGSYHLQSEALVSFALPAVSENAPPATRCAIVFPAGQVVGQSRVHVSIVSIVDEPGWQESTVTWQTRPPHQTPPLGSFDAREVGRVDITPLCTAALVGGDEVTFSLTPEAGGAYVALPSRESPEGGAYVEITFADAFRDNLP